MPSIVLGESGAKRTMQAAREALAAELGARLQLPSGIYTYTRGGIERKLLLVPEDGIWRVLLEITETSEAVAA